MADDATPPVRKLVLKPKEIARTDEVSRLGDGTEISVRLMHKQNELAAQKAAIRRATNPPMDPSVPPPLPTVSSVFARREFDLTDAPSLPGDGTAVSANLILKGNQNMEERHAPEIIAMPMPARRRSKRIRDFILIVAIITAVVACLQMAIPITMGSLVLGLFLIVFGSAVLAWILFGVMDDY